STLIWPYYCGNLFPCHSSLGDGITFSVKVTGAPMGQTTIVPGPVTLPSPSYMVAWATGAYTMIDLGVTASGTHIVAYHLPGGARIACWEDFVLSEGTVSYLEARSVTAVLGEAEGQKVWDQYQARLDAAMGIPGPKAPWPAGGVECGHIDILKDGYFGDIPYV